MILMDKIETALYYSNNYDRRQIKTKKAIIGAFFALLQEKNISKINFLNQEQKENLIKKIIQNQQAKTLQNKI